MMAYYNQLIRLTASPVFPDVIGLSLSRLYKPAPSELLYRIHYILLAFSGGFRMFVACFSDKVTLYWVIIG